MVMNERKGRPSPAKYEIKVRGRLEERWSDYFDGFEITCAAGITTLVGAVRDQAALFGLLDRIRDLNLILISARRLDSLKTDS
jgi:hypothetical protein